jgi:hypothetical protein
MARNRGGSMSGQRRTLCGELDFVERMHDLLRSWCLEPSTDEGHFVNENTVLRLAALLDARCLKPSTQKEVIGDHPSTEQRRTWLQSMTDSERVVRVLFMFRNCIMHNGGRLRRADARSDWYRWFCQSCDQAMVSPGEVLRLPFRPVVAALIAGCRGYAKGE